MTWAPAPGAAHDTHPQPSGAMRGQKVAAPIRGGAAIVRGPMLRFVPKPMPLPSTLDELPPMTPQIPHRLFAICPPSPVHWKAGDGCLFSPALPQPNPSVQAPRSPDQAARADFDALLSAGAVLSIGVVRSVGRHGLLRCSPASKRNPATLPTALGVTRTLRSPLTIRYAVATGPFAQSTELAEFHGGKSPAL